MKGTRSTSVLALLLWCCSCQTSEPPRATQTAHAVPPHTSCKPEAPIAIELTTRAIAPGELEVIARATPTRDVPGVELALALPSHATALAATQARFGATVAGDARAMTTRVRIDQRTSQLTAIARVTVDDVVMARTATVAVGAPAPAQRVTTYALPDGELAREVRP